MSNQDPSKSKIIDNHHRGTVGDFLKNEIENGSSLSIVSAYFTINAYYGLKEYLNGIDGLRFLLGEPDSIRKIDPDNTDEKGFKIVEEGLQLQEQLKQRPIAKACAKWIKDSKVEIRSTQQSNLLHGKMYHIANNGVEKAIMGSSNFTVRGLGLNPPHDNIELNLEVDTPQNRHDLKAWFDEIWNDNKRVKDVKQEVLAVLNQLGKDHAPEFIYYKTLYEMFRDELEARRNNDQKLEDTHLYDTQVWNTLFNFQKEGARSVIARLLTHNGCILADSVGLGKTYTALAVIKFFELRNDSVLVLCPKKLSENWALYSDYHYQSNNPFRDDKFGYKLMSHTDLSLYKGSPSGIDLADFNWSSFDLVVIDESHNFRNDTSPQRDDAGNIIRHSRYTRLLEEVIKAGAKTKVLMLSATPVNTSLLDLRNQIYLMTEKREDVFRNSLGISDIHAVLRQAQKEFKDWEERLDEHGGRDKSKLLAALGADFFKLLGGVSIARSRRQIKQFYAEEISRIGEFPIQRKPINHHPPTDLNGELSYKALSNQIEQFALSIYRPSSYVTGEEAKRRLAKEKEEMRFNQADRERYLIGMIRTNFLKRLESSAHSLTETLGRTIGKIDDLLEKIDRYEQQRTEVEANQLQDDDILPDDDDDDDDFLVNRARHPYHLGELNLTRWKEDLVKDKAALAKAWKSVEAITPERDGKLQAIREHIREKAQNPTTDRDGKTNCKLLVFTTFKDTALYLYENLSELAMELGLKMAMVSGDATQTTVGINNFNAILTNFAPRARGRGDGDGDDIDLLIATDCISEGQNLQDCDTVLNYDIHWNPVRIIQRFGRIDRIGSNNPSVGMINYWPTDDMETYLRLQTRVEARMALADTAASGDDDPLNDEFIREGAERELKFRDKQLMLLRKETPDLDDFDDGVVLSDFTLDYFFDQLLRYLEKNKADLDAADNGVYAITHDEKRPHETGVIFLLRQQNASTDKREKRASPIYPLYAVYIRSNGDIRYGCTNTKQVLSLFESAAVGKTAPLHKLCIQFDQETENGANMDAYNKLLQTVITDISDRHTTTQANNIGIDGLDDLKLSLESESPNDSSDFELVTWLIIKTPQ